MCGARVRERRFYIAADLVQTTPMLHIHTSMNADVQRVVCQFIYTETLAPEIDKGSTIPEDEPPGEVKTSIRHPALLDTFTLVCRTWHEDRYIHIGPNLRPVTSRGTLRWWLKIICQTTRTGSQTVTLTLTVTLTPTVTLTKFLSILT